MKGAGKTNSMDAPEVIENLQDLTLTSREGFVPSRYTVPLREGIDFNDLVQGDGTMFETDLANLAEFEDEESQYFDSEEVFQQLNYECNDFGDDSGSDRDEDVTPFKRMARNMEDLTGDGGVLKKILRQGTGPVVPQGATVRYHSNGYIEFNDEPFDSSRLRNRPYVTKLDEILPGLSIGISTMRRGERSRFLLSPLYAFKMLGCPPRVPANATVLYEVELLSYIDHQAADDYDTFTEEERRQASFEQLLKVADSEREAGNDFYKRKQVPRALKKYLKAIKILEDCHLQNQDQERLLNEVLLKIYLNAAHCSLELAQSARAVKYARKALSIDPRNVKALYRLGKAYRNEGDFEQSKKELKRAQGYDPNNKAIKEALIDLDRTVSDFRALEKEQCRKMFATSTVAKKEVTPDEKSAAGDILEGNKEVLIKRLREFKADQNSTAFSLPSTLSKQEKDFIKTAAKDLGLRVELNEGTCKELKVFKE